MELNTMQQQKVISLLSEQPLFNEKMSLHTTIQIGGPAAALVFPKNADELSQLVQWLRDEKLKYCFMGKGSNTLVLDGGFSGVIINLSKGFKNIEVIEQSEDAFTIRVEGGVPTSRFVRWGTEMGLEGVEKIAGIPGTIGGNLFMNAGTGLGEISEFVKSVETIDKKGKEKSFSAEQCQFKYRKSAIPASSAIVAGVLRFKKGNASEIFKKVKDLFEKRGLAQPVSQPNLGSVFKNPPRKKAWELIEDAGVKGVRVGGARISEKHSNFIVNEGNATAKDVLVLIRMAKDKVKERFGINLETEIQIVGQDAA